ncbi:hypothetical protein [Blastococcus sp. TF02A-35]|uniref:hypothetical protein n=1 Tax=Blastococcus sp. TF02A-35 TaxID=2559612 RepID=UPI0010749223|nr:hypothetical protein [Blastococcus sp. TF02A_35]TFV49538.1 hypothetical protein E4P43_11865 [Blastococcus sp. TF02A_35]
MGLVKTVTAAIRSRKSAESEVARLERAVATWEDDAQRTATELEELEASTASLVDSDDPRAAAREMAGKAMELRFLVDGARAAAEKSRLQLRDAREELALAQAAEKRQQAAKLTAEADAHQVKVDELLRQLEELDGPRYVPDWPTPEEHQRLLNTYGRVERTLSKSEVLRKPIGPLLAEAEQLERQVREARADRAERESPVVPSASVIVPRWDDIDGTSQVSCSVNRGTGSVTFEVSTSADGIDFVTLPDEQGRRSWGKRVKLQAGGGRATVRCNGQVLAEEHRPGRLLNDGVARWWVDAVRCPTCRHVAPVTKRAPSKTSSYTDGDVLAIACQSGCQVRSRDLAGQGAR